MKKYNSRITNMLLNMLDTSVKLEIDGYVKYVCDINFVNINSLDDIYKVFGDSIIDFISNLSDDEKIILRNWTGYNFRNINAILRGNWNYNTNGMLTNKNDSQYRKDANLISEIVNKFSLSNINFVTYRGVSIDAFSGYGISNISELCNISGKFMYEQGFTSTSLLKETSYFGKDIGDGRKYNIEMKYLITDYFEDGAVLINNDISYSVNQNEFLINKNSLLKILDVKVDGDKAYLTVVPIPKKIWNIGKNREYGSSKIK